MPLNNLEIFREKIEADPTADLVILQKKVETENGSFWRVVEVIRLQGYHGGGLSLVDKAELNKQVIGPLIKERYQHTGAQGYDFLNADEAREIADLFASDKPEPRIYRVIREQAQRNDFADVSFIDVKIPNLEKNAGTNLTL